MVRHMQVLFIRHGEADYSPCDARGYIGHGRDLAPLSAKGREQAHAAAGDSRLAGAQLLLSSPYTRALQTAAIIGCRVGLAPVVEVDLHEWMPDTTFQYKGKEELLELCDDFTAHQGCWPAGEQRRWEQNEHIFRRSSAVLERYMDYEKIIVVTHGMVMRNFRFINDIHNCEIVAVEYTPGFQMARGWFV